MVLDTRAINGQEETGAAQTEAEAAEKAKHVIGAAITLGVNALKGLSRSNQPDQVDLAKNPLYKSFYQGFVQNDVPPDIADRAAKALIRGEAAETNSDIAKANSIVMQAEIGQDTSQPKASSEESLAISDKAVGGNSEAESLERNSATEVGSSANPAKMSWNAIQKEARAIARTTEQKPAGNKKAQLVSFIQAHRAQQNHKTSAEAEPDNSHSTKEESERTADVQPPKLSAQLRESAAPQLGAAYTQQLQNSGVTPQTARAAAKELVGGKGAADSQPIAEAHRQAVAATQPQRSRLQQMYYDALCENKVKPELAELASQDLAAGKGALSSQHVRMAHDQVLDRELKSSRLPEHSQHWQKYGRYVDSTDFQKRDHQIAKNAFQAGRSRKEVGAMLRAHSPVAQQAFQEKGTNAALGYVDSVGTKAYSAARVKSTHTSQQVESSSQAVRPRKKSQGIAL